MTETARDMNAMTAETTNTASTAAPRTWEKVRGRYSRFVTLMRLVLPVFATALLALVVAWPQMRNRDAGFQLGYSNLSVDEAESLRMLNPRYAGLDDNQLPYQVTAEVASQDSPKADTIALEKPKADMTQTDGSWVALEAAIGHYGQKSELLDLSGGVNLFHDSGYEFNSPSARIHLDKGMAEGQERVVGHGPLGEIEAEGFRLVDKGKTIFFTGKSRLLMYPSEDDPSQAPAEQSPGQPAGGRP